MMRFDLEPDSRAAGPLTQQLDRGRPLRGNKAPSRAQGDLTAVVDPDPLATISPAADTLELQLVHRRTAIATMNAAT